MPVSSAAELELLKDAIRRNASHTCPTCGRQGASLNVTVALEDLVEAIRHEQRLEAAASGEAVSPNIGTAA